ncbi:hypothetical protein BJY00DRAFT_314254 [Aspergillus carlsbadensis]|nr:hypothetical protein BJY00DRAFT_314254 [Aspergillus carlsbadensis]
MDFLEAEIGAGSSIVTETGLIIPSLPSRFLFIDPWDLNNGFLSHTVNLAHQSSVLIGKVDNRNFLEPAFQIGYEDGLYTNTTRDWTPEMKRAILMALEKEINLVEEASDRAIRSNQQLIAFVLPQWLINPGTLGKGYSPYGYHAPAWQAAMANIVPAMYSLRADGRFSFTPLNESMFPDGYLCTWRMVFTIRHPIVLFGAIYRDLTRGKRLPAEVMRPVCELFMTFRWLRALYDWADTQNTAYVPTIVQWETITTELRPMVAKICDMLQLDESVVLFENLEQQIAAQGPGLQQNEAVYGILTSQGVEDEQAKIAVATSAWEVEFGKPAAHMIADFARAAIPDWKYLSVRAMTPT